ncbi:electron carrier/ protein disulfide oxidoreductase [Anaeramoeba flamelloides]|uniref:Electron carrier/ protein disulfide oxidoreductase n=1 Tax=Anaeramoeba flamelloides TaxID=1746091 RepID=A0AAV8ACG1_9EUKA|nr:electron carrier/ protein disulfide oxidoreductase [Anaeramoeba flamelloides]
MGNKLGYENLPRETRLSVLKKKIKRLSKKTKCVLLVDSNGNVLDMTRKASRMFGFNLRGSSIPFLHLCATNQDFLGATTKELLPLYANQALKKPKYALEIILRFRSCSVVEKDNNENKNKNKKKSKNKKMEKETKNQANYHFFQNKNEFFGYVYVVPYKTPNSVFYEVWVNQDQTKKKLRVLGMIIKIRKKINNLNKKIQVFKEEIKQHQIKVKQLPNYILIEKQNMLLIQEEERNSKIQDYLNEILGAVSKNKEMIKERQENPQQHKKQITYFISQLEQLEKKLFREYEKHNQSKLIKRYNDCQNLLKEKKNEKMEILNDLHSIRSSISKTIKDNKKNEQDKSIIISTSKELIKLDKEKKQIEEIITRNKSEIQELTKKLKNKLIDKSVRKESSKFFNQIKKITRSTIKLRLSKLQLTNSTRVILNKTITDEILWALQDEDDEGDDSNIQNKQTLNNKNTFIPFSIFHPPKRNFERRENQRPKLRHSHSTSNSRIFYRTKSIKDVTSLTRLEEFKSLPIAFSFFKEYLSERMCYEPLLFWLDMQDWYQYYREENADEMVEYIIQTYIDQSALFSLDVDDKTRKHYYNLWEIEDYNINMFDELKQKIQTLLENKYLSDFRESYLNLELGELNVSKNKSFVAKPYLEFGIFQSAKTINVLNMNIDYKEKIDNPCKFSSNLIEKLIDILNEQYYDALASIYSTKFIKSIAYQKLLYEIAGLQNIDLDQLLKSDSNSKVTFFINIYNLLFVHSLILNDQITSNNSYKLFLDQSLYNIGGKNFSLNCIKKGIFKLSTPQNNTYQLQDYLQHYYRYFEFNQDIHFLLLNPTQQTPNLFCFHRKKLKQEIDECKNQFYKKNFEIIENEKVILLPQLFNKYWFHFGKNSNKLKTYLKTFSNLKEIDLSKYNIRFIPQNFENQIIFEKRTLKNNLL